MTGEKAIEILKGHPPFSEEDFVEWEEAYDMAIEALKAKPVKHGKWIERHLCNGDVVYQCDQKKCYKVQIHMSPYCPMCGAMMDEVEE